MANNVIDAAIRLRDLFTPTVRSVNASLGAMKTQMAAAKQSVSGRTRDTGLPGSRTTAL